jgi:histidinol-phosphatase
LVYDKELTAAMDAAQRAGLLQMESLSKLKEIELKSDRSPVTEVDRRCESLIIDLLSKKFSSDGFLGEETGSHDGQSARKWIIDPLDGTRPFIHGIPTHSVLIALEDEGVPVVGVIYLPAMNLTCWACSGMGAYLNGKKIHVSNVNSLNGAMGSALGFLERADITEGKQLFSLMRSWDYSYGFMDAYSYVCVAAGMLDICVNLLDKAWDCASAACIISEAGGKYSDIYGERSVHKGSFVISNGFIHEAALGYFKK